jgi:Rhodopirellula transposase DDE domain
MRTPRNRAHISSLSAAIAATTTKTGLKVRCQLDENTYPAGIRVSDAEMDAVNLTRHDFHSEWNYTISPLALER